jgi:CHAD domain-containing protein
MAAKRKERAIHLLDRRDFLRRAQARSVRIHQQLREATETRWPSAQLLHDLHRELRRGRLDVRVLLRESPPTLRRALSEADRTLHELADHAGAARDRDVMAALLLDLSRRKSWAGGTERCALELERRMQAEARKARQDLRRAAARRLSQGRARLPKLPSPRGVGFEERFRRATEREIERRYRELERALPRAQRRPSPERLHALRIAMRRCRNLGSALTREERPGLFPASWRKLQQELGDYHDLCVLESWVARETAHGTPPRLRRDLRRAIRRREKAARGRLGPAMQDLGRVLDARPRA